MYGSNQKNGLKLIIDNMYTYKAKLNRVVDGDTVNLTIDLGFKLTYTANCRLAGINAPEMNTEEGKVSKVALMQMLSPEFTIESTGLDKYGRPVVRIGNINDKMVEGGYATKY
jgi:endonuclease YncB( thermonuclease family)